MFVCGVVAIAGVHTCQSLTIPLSSCNVTLDFLIAVSALCFFIHFPIYDLIGLIVHYRGQSDTVRTVDLFESENTPNRKVPTPVRIVLYIFGSIFLSLAVESSLTCSIC